MFAKKTALANAPGDLEAEDTLFSHSIRSVEDADDREHDRDRNRNHVKRRSGEAHSLRSHDADRDDSAATVWFVTQVVGFTVLVLFPFVSVISLFAIVGKLQRTVNDVSYLVRLCLIGIIYILCIHFRIVYECPLLCPTMSRSVAVAPPATVQPLLRHFRTSALN